MNNPQPTLPLGGISHANPELERIRQLVATVGVNGLLPEELAEYQKDPAAALPQPDDHYANLAEFLDDSELDHIAQDVIRWVLWDEESRRDWELREKKGIQLLGVSERTEGGAAFEGANKVVHPLLAEAITQFHSRAIAEMWPPSGPVKTQVLGELTPELVAQAQRVQDYLNYLYTMQMPGGFEEQDQMLFRLPLSGSCFKKVYYDPLEQCICSRLVEPSDFVVPFSAMDLRTTPRFTHRLREMHNDVLKKIQSGYYKKAVLSEPINETYDYPIVKDEIALTEGRRRTQIAGDQRHTIYEMYVDYDLDGFEDKDEAGEETEIALPYIITVDRDSQKILRIQRNWKPDDPLKRKCIYFAHYKFTPGYGFYGYGLLHLIGGLSSAATGSLRALMDAAAFANMQGGFKTRDSKVKGGDTPIAPGEWREVDSSAEDLAKAFFPFPYKEPSETLFRLLQYLDERGQRFAGTTDNLVGEANNNAPVGTTLALIEQGSKTFSAIHKRLHEAAGKEFKITHDLCYDYLPEHGYPYALPGASQTVMARDFDGRVDVVPVSDPSIISSTQRITQAQAILDLAGKFPGKINVDVAIKNMLTAMRVPNPEDYLQTSVDPMADTKAQLEIQQIKAELARTQAEAVAKNIDALYSAEQAAQVVASNPQVASLGDAIAQSAGFNDANGYPLTGAATGGQGIGMPTQGQGMPIQGQGMPMQGQGMPMTPGPNMTPPNHTNPMLPAHPLSPGMGVMHGIETPANDGAVRP